MVEDRGGGIRFDLHAGHVRVRRGRVEVLQGPLRVADEHDLAAEVVRRERMVPAGRRPVLLRVVDARERHPGDGVLSARIVDPARPAELLAGDLLVEGHLGRDHVQRGNVLDRVDHLAVHAARLVLGEQRGPGARADRLQQRGPLSRAQETDLSVPALVRRRGVERGDPGVVADRLEQGEVVARERRALDLARLAEGGLVGEFDVEHDRLGVLGGDVVDQLGVVGARERERVQVLEGLVVDRDDRDVRRRLLRAAGGEASVDRVALERVEHARRIQRDPDRGRPERHQRQQQNLEVPVALQ